ncbi:Demethylmenaquinone methyltransferase [Escovopsis weberi]|uniref:Demethylmenaquinone methyltransferase n=1 Tax=Escovopsis weberi TaxID=150374 RepID=A0A0M8N6Y1_ESCWE|nr:Demethylmenaquinone methyltransferase [Escovopsis weberi]
MSGSMLSNVYRPEFMASSGAHTHTSSSARTASSSGPPSSAVDPSRLFVQRNGRSYFSDPTNPYPLPTDITELHRQTMRTLLMIQLFGAPTSCSTLIKKPPTRVLEIGCGSGFWSMMCHQYYKARGYSGISFTGIDIAPLAPETSQGMDGEMNWKFIQADLLQWPWPLPSGEYDFVMAKDMSLLCRNLENQNFIDEYIRILKPGGVLEIWDSDHLVRMLRPHEPAAVSGEDADEQLAAASLGAYVVKANTPLSAPLNTYLVEYDQWLNTALQSRQLSAVPCTLIEPLLRQESEVLGDVRSRRLAIPLSDVRWEREGVGGVITKDGKSSPDSRGKDGKEGWEGREQGTIKADKKALSAGQMALRQAAMSTVVQMVQALEPMLREASGKSQDEWDVWLGKMMGDLINDGGTSWGECLEVGAWSARKKPAPSS